MQRLDLPWWTRLLARPLPWVKLDHYTRDIPESNAFLYLPLSDGNWFWRILWVAAKHRAGVLQAEFPAYAQPCLAVAEVLEAQVVLVEHNVEYARLKAQLPELSAAQYQRLREIEIDLCNRSGAVVCVSDNDRQQLADDGVHPGLLHTIPHGIDLAAWRAAQAADARTRFGIPADAPVLVYHGTFAYPPNRDALKVLGREILPRLEARGILAHVLAVGHKPPADPGHARIHATGSVEDVAPWLKAADIAVVPLREGGGTRMKIIDCFAADLPVISTAKGIEGIPAQDGEQALIVDDWDAMAEAIETVLGDATLRRKLVAGGRELAADLDWVQLGARYLDVYGGISR
jgi:glycosyltransferase involved in cell wall biosynthesis